MFIQQRRRNYGLPDEEPLPEKATPEEMAAQNPQIGLSLKPKGGLFKNYKWNSAQLKKRSQICDWGSVVLLVVIVAMIQFAAKIPAGAIAIPLVVVIGLQVYGFRIKARDKALGKAE